MSKELSQYKLTEFLVDTKFGPQVALHLLNDQMQPIIDAGVEIVRDGDLAMVTIFPGLPQVGIGVSPEFIHWAMTNESCEKPDAAEIMAGLFGGGRGGVLSMSSIPKAEPYQRTAGRSSVSEYFNKHLRTSEFAVSLKDRVEGLINYLTDNPDISYDQAMKELRLGYLRELFFGDDISNEEMNTIYDYTEGVFDALLPLFSKKPLKDLQGKSWRQMTPKNLRQIQAESENIVSGVINRRLEAGEYGEDIFGKLMKKIVPHWPNQDKLMELELMSGLCQILFAATDTTSSAIGSALKELAENPELQIELRAHAKTILGKSEVEGILMFDYLKKTDPDLNPFHRFAGKVLTENPPTLVTVRKLNQDIEIGGYRIKQGTNIILALGEAQNRWVQEQGETDNFTDLADSYVFGKGRTACVGRHFALYELLATVMYFLDRTQNISLVDADKINRRVGSTLRHENLNLQIVR